MPVSTETKAAISLSPGEAESFFPGEQVARLRALLPAATWVDPTATSGEAWRAMIRESRPEVVITAWRAARLPDAADGLKLLCHVTGSLRGVMPRSLLAAGVRATNWGAIASPLVAEHALLLTLGALRCAPRWGPYFAGRTDAHADAQRLATRSLRDRRVAVHGFGMIAREFIKLLRPFGCDVVAYSAGVPEAFYAAHGVRSAGDLEALAAAADVFVTCEALTDRTRDSITRDVLMRLPFGSVFVNVGRGAVVDEAALAAVAIERHLRLGCDVFAVEPLPADAPLRAVPDAFFSPHVAGPTHDWFPRCGAAAIENVGRYLRGEPLTNEVTLELYDRST